ncbi:unnamed protein product [Mycena citricolor]|uniref:Uncharacterized protein n=1 Tax=Mycena citricolor TaxID=2018698 RepID=A0AAD2HI30_9AGAR|nr:unnamed protein product [Mycena citricolor]
MDAPPTMKLYILLAYITATLASCQNTSPFDFGLEAIYADSDISCHGRTAIPVHAVEVFAVPHISWSTLITSMSANAEFSHWLLITVTVFQQTSEEMFLSQQATDGGFSSITQGK